jgi:hypothetical protein
MQARGCQIKKLEYGLRLLHSYVFYFVDDRLCSGHCTSVFGHFVDNADFGSFDFRSIYWIYVWKSTVGSINR